ncbi:3-beta-hydroxysteroid dehydrogenase [Dactylonectria estremocensis]|uniref:3-beta-hydroxysteroid dehydrogenase n=1 Tax=Dactylonectria estremocensis TaxID=1079267 RepID=A0A9P9FDC2_9HYPO|nr:3-beta-hydroxysteroid dehydrogenase [Dactylonectria estremocensis]
MAAPGQTETKVAIITGGASGLGLGVAIDLAKRGQWFVHILDLDTDRGEAAAKGFGPIAAFHRINVNDYASLAAVFDKVFRQHCRLDLVFANAGIVDNVDFYAKHDGQGPPPELDQVAVDIDLKSVIATTYLAQHYFRLCPHVAARNVIMTASVGSLYPCFAIPMYTGAKHGVVGFLRAIAPRLVSEGIRANAILPGVVATNLMTEEDFEHYPPECFTPLEAVTGAVLQIVDGMDMSDAKGRTVQGADVYGQAVEINMNNIYFRDQPEWCDEAMPHVLAATER